MSCEVRRVWWLDRKHDQSPQARTSDYRRDWDDQRPLYSRLQVCSEAWYHGRISPQRLTSLRPSAFSRGVFLELVAKEMIKASAPYTTVNCRTFQALLNYVQMAPNPLSVKLPNPPTIKTVTENQYILYKSRIESILQAEPHLAFTTDSWWTQGRSKSFLGVTVHWIDKEDWELKSVLICFEELLGSHTGAKLAKAFHAVLEDFKIVSKSFFCTKDIASNMYKMAGEPEHLLGLD